VADRYYLKRKNLIRGPYALATLQKALDKGHIDPSDLLSTDQRVWVRADTLLRVPDEASRPPVSSSGKDQDGDESLMEWLAREVPLPPSPATPPPRRTATPSLDPIDAILLAPALGVDAILEAIGRVVGGGFFRALALVAGRLGHLGVLLATLVSSLEFGRRAIVEDSLRFGLVALCCPVLLAFGQLIAWRFTDLCDRMVDNTPTSASGTVLFRLLGLVLFLAGVAAAGTVTLTVASEPAVLRNIELLLVTISGLALASVLVVAGVLFLSPAALNLQTDLESSAGRDGLSLVVTFIKAPLAAARFTSASFCIVGGVAVTAGVLTAWLDCTADWPPIAISAGYAALLPGLTMPMVIYLVSVVALIAPEVQNAILRMGRSVR